MGSRPRFSARVVSSALAAVALCVMPALLAQAPVASVSSATVAGLVIRAGSAQPLAGVRVQLAPYLGPTGPGNAAAVASGRAPDFEKAKWYSATTGEDGRFSIDNVAPGEYRLFAFRSGGWLPAEFGQRSATDAGSIFTVAAGQSLRDLQLPMTPTGSIAGRVYDADGPAGRVLVQARRPVYREGTRTMTIVQSVLTNDRGEYRLFWLPPGPYYVVAKPANDRSFISQVRIAAPTRGGGFEEATGALVTNRTLPNGETVEEAYAPVYYPGTTAFDAAGRIELRAGATAEGLDISLVGSSVRTRHVRGVVLNANGQPAANASVMAVPRTREPSIEIPNARSNPDGSFDLAGVMPGSHLLFTNTSSGSGGVALQVGEADVDNVSLLVIPGFRVSGRFTVLGQSRTGAELDMALLRLTLRRNPDFIGMPQAGPSFTPPPAADGSFVMEGVAVGDFRVEVRALPPDAYVKSIQLGTADVLDGGLHLSGTPRDRLEVVIVAAAGSLTGTVVDAKQEAQPRTLVAIVPETADQHRLDLYKSTMTDRSGRFQIQGLAEGRYRVFAWEAIEDGAWRDPDVIRTYDNRGTSVRIRDGNDENVQLTVIPAR